MSIFTRNKIDSEDEETNERKTSNGSGNGFPFQQSQQPVLSTAYRQHGIIQSWGRIRANEKLNQNLPENIELIVAKRRGNLFIIGARLRETGKIADAKEIQSSFSWKSLKTTIFTSDRFTNFSFQKEKTYKGENRFIIYSSRVLLETQRSWRWIGCRPGTEQNTIGILGCGYDVITRKCIECTYMHVANVQPANRGNDHNICECWLLRICNCAI